MEKIICYTDGMARGNPGPAALGVQVLSANDEVVLELQQSLGNGSENFAAYMAVVVCLQALKDQYGEATKDMEFELRLSSPLVKEQLNSERPITEPFLVPQFIEIHNLRVASFPHFTLTHIAREENKEAHRLVNEALDA